MSAAETEQEKNPVVEQLNSKTKHDPVLFAVFILSVLIAFTMIMMLLAEQVPNSAGFAHGVFAGMNQGGDGETRLANIALWAFSFECLLYALIVALCALGVPAQRRDKRLYILLAGCFLFMLLVWWQMYFGHQRFLDSGETNYFMGFPSATAWQLYGTWLSGIPLMLIYCIWFKDYVFSDADEEKFAALLAKQSNHSASTAQEQ